MLKRLALNTSTNFGLRFFNIVLQLISIPVIINAVGDEAYGLILLAVSIIGYFSILNGGVPAGTVKYISEFAAKEDYQTVNQVINSSIVLFIGVGLLIAISLFGFIRFGGLALFNITSGNIVTAGNILKIAAVIAVFQWPVSVLGQTLNGLQRYAENNVYKGLGNLLSRGGAIALAILGFPVEIIFICSSLSGILPVFFQYHLIRKLLPTWRLRISDFSIPTVRMIFGYSLWMLLSKISSILIYQTDRIILSIFLPVSSLTIYHVITMPIQFIKQMSGLFNSAITPLVSSEYAKGGKKRMDKFIYTLSKYSNAFFAPLAVIGTYLSASFILLWMGPDYTEYAWIAQLGCLFQLFWQMNASLGRVFYGSGVVKEITLIALFGAVINVPLGIWLVTEIGVAGVVFSTIFAGVISVPLQYIFAMPKLEIKRMDYFRSVMRGQIFNWAMGLLIIPFWPYFLSLHSWVSLILTAASLAVIFYGVSWFFIVQQHHRNKLYSFLSKTFS